MLFDVAQMMLNDESDDILGACAQGWRLQQNFNNYAPAYSRKQMILGRLSYQDQKSSKLANAA
ncbi:MAG: hypothetical protein ABSG57_02920 [Candidatus Bathyarchaeia archaeon]